MTTKVLGRVAPLYKGNYSNSTNYIKFDVVFDGESSFISKQGTAEAPNVGHALTDETWWGLLCKGNYLAIQPLTDRVTELEADVSGLDEDTVQLRSDFNTLLRDTTPLLITSWGNSNNISAKGQYYYSTTYKELRVCTNFESQLFEKVNLKLNMTYIFGNKLYVAKNDLSALIEGDSETISTLEILKGVTGGKNSLTKHIGWLTSISIYDRSYTTSRCVAINTKEGSIIKLYKESTTNNCHYQIVKDFTGKSFTQLDGYTRQTLINGTESTITMPVGSTHIIITFSDEGVDCSPTYIIIDNFRIGNSIPDFSNFVTLPEVLDAINYSSSESNSPTPQKRGYYVNQNLEIVADERYNISSPISVKKGDYFSFMCTTNISLPSSVISMCDSDGIPTKMLYASNGVDNFIYSIFIEDNGYINLSYNKNFTKSYKHISFEVMSLLYELIITKQKDVNIKTINGISLQGEGDVTIAQGPQGIQGIQGPQGPQGNSGYSGQVGELEVVNNIVDGGEVAALSAEQGKILGNFNDYNNLPIIPSMKHSIDAYSVDMNSSEFTSNIVGSIISGYVFHNDIVTKENRKAVKIALPLNTSSILLHHTFENSFDATSLFLKFGIHAGEEIAVEDLKNITIFMASGDPTISSNRCSYGIYSSGDAQHSRTGAFYQCLNLYRVGTKGGNFDVTNVKYAGFVVNYNSSSETIRNLYITDLAFAYPLKKPGVCIIVDNFAPNVVNMADYAYSKGVKLNLSVIPNWIGGAKSATLEQIHGAKRQGHFIWNHTWNHVTTAQTELQIGEEFIKSDLWLMKHGFSRGSKVYSNPSAYYDNIRYKTHFNSNAQAIYHHWTTYPSGEGRSEGNEIYLLLEPVYPANRMALNISGLDWNNPNDANTAYFIKLAQAAIDYGGIAVIGFHGTFWDGNLNETTLAGDRWKRFIDAISSQIGQYFYGIDDIVEGRFI